MNKKEIQETRKKFKELPNGKRSIGLMALLINCEMLTLDYKLAEKINHDDDEFIYLPFTLRVSENGASQPFFVKLDREEHMQFSYIEEKIGRVLFEFDAMDIETIGSQLLVWQNEYEKEED